MEYEIKKNENTLSVNIFPCFTRGCSTPNLPFSTDSAGGKVAALKTWQSRMASLPGQILHRYQLSTGAVQY